MLGKLIKHEFRATTRRMIPFLIVLLALSLINRFTLPAMKGNGAGKFMELISYIALILTILAFVAVAVVAFMVLIERFRKNVLGQEGYLTMTLPVTVHEILWSKFIVNFVWTIVVFIVVTGAILINLFDFGALVFTPDQILGFKETFTSVFVFNAAIWFFELCLAGILLYLEGCLMLYGSLSLGHLFRKHRTGMAVVIFAVLLVVITITAGYTLAGANRIWEAMTAGGEVSLLKHHGFIWLCMIPLIIIDGLLYLLTAGILKNKLNLE